MTSRVRLRWLQRVLLVLGLLLLASWSTTYFRSRRFQMAESERLEVALGKAGSPGAVINAAFSGPLALDSSQLGVSESVLGRLEISGLRIAAMVAEGVDTKTLDRAVGHIPSTALPGGLGNCALAGHRDTFLRGLGGVRVSDLIRIVTPERTYHYEVLWSAVVEPRRVDVLDSTATRSLTLVTCYPFEFIGRAPLRFVVRARQIEAEESAAIQDRESLERQFQPVTHGRSATNGGSNIE
jgi:sortase A